MAKEFPLYTIAADADIARNAPLMLHIRLGELLHFSQDIHDVNRVTELHAMRIAAKRLRYTIEIFQPFVDNSEMKTAIASCLSETKKIQELIGEIHDRDIRVPLIYSYLARREHKNPELLPGLTRLINDECRERDRMFNELIEYWDSTRNAYVDSLMSLIVSIATYKPVAPALELTEDNPVAVNSKPRVQRSSKRK